MKSILVNNYREKKKRNSNIFITSLIDNRNIKIYYLKVENLTQHEHLDIYSSYTRTV